MKIFLPFIIRGIGGTASFALKFQEGMRRRGHDVFFEYEEDYDVMLLIVQAPFRYLIDAKRRGKKIIQRLDGTYYWSVAGWKFPLYNLKAAIIRHFFADFTVYQSRYSRYCAERFLGKKRSERSTIIYNGVDLTLFSPEGERLNLRDNPDQKIFFTASAFRRKDQIVPILEAQEIFRKKYGDNFKLLVAGSFSPKVRSIPVQWARFKNVRFLGKIRNADLPKYERSADAFLFTHLNPPCPNNVIEALACGLPICGVADGAMPELIHSGRNALLLPISGDAFWKQRTYDYKKLARNLHSIVQKREIFSQESYRIAKKRFSLDAMTEAYEEVLENIMT